MSLMGAVNRTVENLSRCIARVITLLYKTNFIHIITGESSKNLSTNTILTVQNLYQKVEFSDENSGSD